MSVKVKLLALSCCVLAGLLLAYGIVFREQRLMRRTLTLERLATRVQIEALQMRRQEKNYILRRDAVYLAAVRNHQQAAMAAVRALRRLDERPDPLCAKAAQLIDAYLSGFENMVGATNPDIAGSQTALFLASSRDVQGLAKDYAGLVPALEALQRQEVRWLAQGSPLALAQLRQALERLTAQAARSPAAKRVLPVLTTYADRLRAYAGQLDDTGSYNATFAATARTLEPVIDALRRHYEGRRREIVQSANLAIGLVYATVFMVILLVSLAVFRGVAIPLATLRRHAARVARGEDTDLDPTTFHGEFRDLAWDIARMEKHLVTMILDLAHKEREAAEEAHMAREARRRAEDLARVKSNFLNLVSHELKTPLTTMVGFSQVMLRRLQRGLFADLAADRPELSAEFARFHDNLVIMLAEGRRLAELIENVLDLAALESGNAPLAMGAVSLDDLVDRAVASFKVRIEKKGLFFIREIPPDLPPLRCDRDRMVYVLRHLISNAVKFTETGHIACRARQEGNMAVITVEDTGQGIPPSMREAVFEKFLQLGDKDTDKVPGLGIGLAASRAVVEFHGGTIHISGTPGRGSVVTLTVPLVETVPPRPFA